MSTVRVVVLVLLAWLAVSALLGLSVGVLSTLSRRRLAERIASHVPPQAVRR